MLGNLHLDALGDRLNDPAGDGGATVIVCHCHAVSAHVIEAAALAGARTVEEVTEACAAGGDCGSCHRFIEYLADGVRERSVALSIPA
tara:strand:- start:488 stop:751 length:264 start_codon:yes stop_codon:yes gene_type:complete